jgi:prephenate dehydratase
MTEVNDTMHQTAQRVKPTAQQLTVGTLGGPGTFAQQASLRILELYPEFGSLLKYLPSIDGGWRALDAGAVDVIIAEQTSAFECDEADRRVAPPDSDLFVQVAVSVPYGCTLLAKPGTRLSDLDEVHGPGSIRHCRRWLDVNLPGISTVVHQRNPVEAAMEVAVGDGTRGIVATPATAELTGLVPLARDIDAGATGNWWAISKQPRYVKQPDRLLISARFGDSGELGDLTSALWDLGFRLTTAFSQPTARALFEHDYVLAFSGDGQLVDVRSELHRYAAVRLLGAYELRR